MALEVGSMHRPLHPNTLSRTYVEEKVTYKQTKQNRRAEYMISNAKYMTWGDNLTQYGAQEELPPSCTYAVRSSVRACPVSSAQDTCSATNHADA